MGHPRHEFETIMMSLSHGAKVSEGVPILKPVLKSATTYCFELGWELLKPKSDHFTRTAVNYEAEGLLVRYHCSIDSRTYTVRITPSKD